MDGDSSVVVGWTVATTPEVYAHPDVRAQIEAQARRMFTAKYDIEPTYEGWRYQGTYTVEHSDREIELPARWLRICEATKETT